MKIKSLALLFFVLVTISSLFSPKAKAQDTTDNSARYLVGVSGGDSFNNQEFGGLIGIELPIKKHFEIGFTDAFNPIDNKITVGSGISNQSILQGIGWITKGFGVQSTFEYSDYFIKPLYKGADYVQFGPIWRRVILDKPVRFGLSYSQEVMNGITDKGVETSHLDGAVGFFDVRFGCSGSVCFRIGETFEFGRVLEQGNPACDGSLGSTGGPGGGPCPRVKAFGGGWIGSFRVEFHHHKSDDYAERVF